MQNRFLTDLADFLSTHFKVRLAEPVLGGKKLDIQKLYNWVTANGGYWEVISEKKWKRCADKELKLPETCTNSAFALRNIYSKYLYAFEQVNYFKKPLIDVIAEIEKNDNSSHEHDRITRRTVEKRKSIVDNTPMSAPKVYPLSPRRTELLYHQKHFVPINPDDDNRDEKYLWGRNQSRLLLAIESGLPNEIDWALSKLVKISYSCPETLCIESVVPGLIEALINIIQPFFDCLKLNTSKSNFLTTLNNDRLPKFEEIRMFNLTVDQEKELDVVLNVLQVIRNFSILPPNALNFSLQHEIIEILAKGIALDSTSAYNYIKQDCVSIVESLSPYITVRNENDFFLSCMRSFLFTNDRSLIIGGLKTLTNLCAQKNNREAFLNFEKRQPEDFLKRLFELLLVFGDQMLVSCVLDYLYQYSTLGIEPCKKMATLNMPQILNTVNLLIKFLNYENHQPRPILSNIQLEAASRLQTPKFDPKKFSSEKISKSSFNRNVSNINKNLSELEEVEVDVVDVEGDLESKKRRLNDDLSSTLNNTAAFTSLPNSNLSSPVLSKNTNSHSQSSSPLTKHNAVSDTYYNPLPPQIPFQNLGVQYPQQQNVEQHYTGNKCFWKAKGESNYCNLIFQKEEDLIKHVYENHLGVENEVFECHWKECKFFEEKLKKQQIKYQLQLQQQQQNSQLISPSTILPPSNNKSRIKCLTHFQTHFPLTSNTIKFNSNSGNLKNNKINVNNNNKMNISAPNLNSLPDLVGISLTCLLVLRNLAKFSSEGGYQELFFKIEGDLVLLSCDARYTKFISQILKEVGIDYNKNFED
ncbi:hypothetical protein HK099_000823 [Clydaea vesicula]|uniref:ARID domain-containing protein n=1 Tax=Clydaea vesicula TaxID=447962 RepID=A0AAD5TZ30_9FUNG|nr:hypothetical protein HK099_000823 [Clydaea vesicula]